MAGHRLLLVHLFLPDTLQFNDDEDTTQSIASAEASQALAQQPPSPPEEESELPIHELPSRLARASLQDLSAHASNDAAPHRQATTSSAISDADGPPLPPIGAPRKTGSRSARTSFSDASKAINMSSLMAEATSAPAHGAEGIDISRVTSPGNLLPLPRSRRGSPSGGVRPGLNIIENRSGSGSGSEPLPVAVASDHGRSADSDNMGALSTSAGSHPGGSSMGTPTGGPGGAAGVPGRLRSGSSAAGAMGPPAPRAVIPEGTGTRTPGARLAGKAGTMTPLSIIGDLAAKQSMLQPQPASTPGDSERHHPFGSGAVTPMHGAQTPGHSVRTPGGASAGFVHHALKRPPMSLNMTSTKEIPRVDAAGPSSSLKALGNKAASPLGPNVGAASQRPPLGRSNLSTSRVTSAVASGTINDHGRGAAVVESPLPLDEPPKASSPQPASSSAVADVTSSPTQQVRRSGVTTSNSGSIRMGRAGSTTSGPPAAPSSSWNRSSKSRNARSSTLRRTPSLARTLGRRESSASLDIWEDGLAEGSHSPANLPPYDFTPNPGANGGLVNAVSSVGRDRLRAGRLWIGTPSISIDGWAGPAEKQHMTDRLRTERGCVPVWVEDDLFQGHYNHFCKQILWPTFHYTLPTQKGLESEHEAFLSYRELNRRFADAIVKEYKEGDIIWVNDYHLLLVPQMVRERLPHATIGFFLHIAFPSSEIFRCLAMREDILRGMLGADLIGFQTTNFCRHFRQTVSRILQLEATPKGIHLDGRYCGRRGFVAVNPFPIGIDVRSLNRKRADPEVEEWVQKLRARYDGKKVIVGRDKLDWIKGVRQKLLAFEVFLDEHPEWVGKAVLIQVALATTEENEEIGAATDVVARINNKHSSLTYQPVVFLHVQDITFSQYLALLTIADAFLACSLREGMNLTSHEYVVCQEVKHRPLILSEFTGTYSALRACIGINPLNTKQVAHAIFKAVSMDDDEAFARWNDLHRAVVTQTSQHWLVSLLSKLERAHLEQQRRDNSFIPRLEIGQLVSEWRASKLRLLLIDLEETILDDETSTKAGGRQPFSVPERTLALLRDLCADSKNRVYILSGHGTAELDSIQIPGLGKIAENGCAIRYAGARGDDDASAEWVSLVAGMDMTWREPVKELLHYFTERTPGSWMEDRGCTILWRFWSGASDDEDRSQEAQWARRQSAEVQNLIYDSLGERFSLRIIPGSTSFLILPKGVSRATAVQHLVSLSSMGLLLNLAHSPASSSRRESSGASSFHAPLFHPATRSVATSTTDASLYKEPSNAFHPISASGGAANGSLVVGGSGGGGGGGMRASGSGSGWAHTTRTGSFDFALALGQDDALMAYVNGLDLPFAPITCSTGMQRGKGSEASVYLEGTNEARVALEELVRWRSMDARWGPPSMADI